MIILRSPCSVAALIVSLVLPYAALAQQPLPAEGNESQLLAVLNSDVELFEKAKACQRLAIIGTSKSVPVVAKLLADPNLSHYARFALESNPSSEVDKAFRQALGDEVLTGRGELFTRSQAALHLFSELGGIWRLLAWTGGLVPGPVRNGTYDIVARVRYRVFGTKPEACPLLPPHLRDRFET